MNVLDGRVVVQSARYSLSYDGLINVLDGRVVVQSVRYCLSYDGLMNVLDGLDGRVAVWWCRVPATL